MRGRVEPAYLAILQAGRPQHMETPSHPKPIAKKSRWELRLSDFPSKRLIKVFPELQDIENNCVFRFLAMKSRAQTWHSTLQWVWVSMMVLGAFAFNSYLTLNVRIVAGCVGVFGIILNSSMGGARKALYRIPDAVLEDLVMSTVNAHDILLGIIAAESSKGRRFRAIIQSALLTGVGLTLYLIGGWMLVGQMVWGSCVLFGFARLSASIISPMKATGEVRQWLRMQARSTLTFRQKFGTDEGKRQRNVQWADIFEVMPIIIYSQLAGDLPEGSWVEIVVPTVGGVIWGLVVSWMALRTGRNLAPLEEDIQLILNKTRLRLEQQTKG